MKLPEEYQEFVKVNGLFEGFTSEEPGYIQLWRIEELPSINSEIYIEELAPGYLTFASDGGGEVLAFDQSGAVFKLPMIGMAPQYAIRIAESVGELVSRFQDHP